MFSNLTIYLQRIGVAFGLSLALVGAVVAQIPAASPTLITPTSVPVEEPINPQNEDIDYETINPKTIPGQGFGRFVEGYWKFRSQRGSPQARENALKGYKQYVVGACEDLAQHDQDKAKQILDSRVPTIDEQRAENAESDAALAVTFEQRSKAEMARMAALAGGDFGNVFQGGVNAALKANMNVRGFLGRPMDIPPEALQFLPEDERAALKGLSAGDAFSRISKFMQDKGLPQDQMFAAMAGATAANLPPGFVPAGKLGDIQKFAGFAHFNATNGLISGGFNPDDFKGFISGGSGYVQHFDSKAHVIFQNYAQGGGSPDDFVKGFSGFSEKYPFPVPGGDFQRKDDPCANVGNYGSDYSKKQECYKSSQNVSGGGDHGGPPPGGDYPKPGEYKGGTYPDPKSYQQGAPAPSGQQYQYQPPSSDTTQPTENQPYQNQQYPSGGTATQSYPPYPPSSTSSSSPSPSPTSTYTSTYTYSPTPPSCSTGNHYVSGTGCVPDTHN